MKRPASARAVAKAKGKTTTKGIGKDKGKGKGEKGNGKGKGKIDDDAAPRAAIRAEADATADVEDATMHACDALQFILDMHRQHANNRARFRARRLSMELDLRDRNAH